MQRSDVTASKHDMGISWGEEVLAELHMCMLTVCSREIGASNWLREIGARSRGWKQSVLTR